MVFCLHFLSCSDLCHLFRPLPFVPLFWCLMCHLRAQPLYSFNLPFYVFPVRSCSCLTHELDLSALDECRVGKAELPKYLCDQGPVIEFLMYGNTRFGATPACQSSQASCSQLCHNFLALVRGETWLSPQVFLSTSCLYKQLSDGKKIHLIICCL